MSIASFFAHLASGVPHTEQAINTSMNEALHFAGVALGMGEAAAAVADPALLPAMEALKVAAAALPAVVSGVEGAMDGAAGGASTAAQAVAALVGQAEHVINLAAPAVKVVGNAAAKAG